MATPGELVKVVATVLGLPDAYVASTYRSLREAGLVTKGGRGPSAAKMTARDAATLLGGILGTGQIVDAANAVNQFLTRIPHSPPTPFKRVKIAGIADLQADHSFIDALEAIINVAAEGKLVRAVPPKWNKVTVSVANPDTSATIIFTTDPMRGTIAHARYELPKRYDPKDYEARRRRRDAILTESREVGTMIFLYLGALLAGKLDDLPGLETFEVTR
jgi:hypothetical protein